MNKIYSALFTLSLTSLGAADIALARDVTDIVDDWWKSTAYRGGSGGDTFRMWSNGDIPEYFDTHVYKVRVRHGERIDGFQFLYDYNGASQTKSSNTFGGSGGSWSSFTLDDDEYIKKVKACTTSSTWDEGRIGYLKFWTSDGDTYAYGDTASNCKTWGGYHKQHILGFWGRDGDEIDRLGIYVGPRVDLEVTDIDLDTTSYATATNATTFSSSQVLFNDSSSSQSTSIAVSYTDKSEFSNTYSETSGITTTSGVEVGVSSDWFGLATVSATLSSSVSSEESLTVGETVTESSTTTTKITVNATVPAYTVMIAEAIAYYTNEEVDYTMTVENTYTGEEFDVEGTFSGVSTSVYGSWTEIGTIENGVIDIYDAFEDEYGHYE